MAGHDSGIADLATPLDTPADLDPLLDRIGGATVVMLGEASHGTAEFYTWRAALTRRLIEEMGFSFVAVEGDWPDCDRVDRAVRLMPGAPADPRDALLTFERWPTWMWANEEVVAFTRWLRGHNETRDPADRAGFHGLDVYSLWESLREILVHLREHDPDQVSGALAAYRCFEPFQEDPQRYAHTTRVVPASCELEVIGMLQQLRERAAAGGPDTFGVWQNAEVVAGAERYYRAMVRSGRDSWNVRDRHMDETLDRLMGLYGPGAKAVVWAHNSHVGDARFTDMGGAGMGGAGMVSIGQLGRERFGPEQVVLVGYGTHHGTVTAGDGWGAPMREMTVPAGRRRSLEELLHRCAPENALFVFPEADKPSFLTATLKHRAIGVVYHPEAEQAGNWVPTVLGDRYDAFCWFDATEAVRPLDVAHIDVHEPETYPSGV
jgi:erythromycin esterase